ncbi:MAG TPA: nitrilase-related carbon-nitrogen hydrolase [Ktedonobacterales bacterium]|nr:nitrilase-related carbon-nitrogen hydrolase [Ktedonobacterales bacterium]
MAEPLTTTTARVRAVAVGNQITLPATEAAFVAELERIVGLGAQYLSPNQPNVLVLGEMLGLPAAFTGQRALLARHAATARTAMAEIAAGLLPRIIRCRQMWPGISLPRALLLAATDALYRPFAETLARLAAQYHTHLVATTLAPRVRQSDDPREIARWGRRGAQSVYLPAGREVYNAALVFGPDGALLQRVNKVYLTSRERETLDLTPGLLSDARAIPTAAGRLGVAISLDAFTPDYLRHLDAQGVEIVLQPDANDQLWAAPSKTCEWQPAEWLNSVLGSVQPLYPHLRYNICAMQTGNLFDTTFDGQSSITARDAPALSRPGSAFVGVDETVHTVTGAALAGGFLAVAPWVMIDPVTVEPHLTLSERRARLATLGRELLPGGGQANRYRETAIWADLSVTTGTVGAGG